MVHHLTSRTFDNELERIACEAKLKQRGFFQVSPTAKLKAGEYHLTGGTSDPNSFEGQKQYSITWCEDK